MEPIIGDHARTDLAASGSATLNLLLKTLISATSSGKRRQRPIYGPPHRLAYGRRPAQR